MKVKVLDIQGKATGREVELPDNVFGVEPNDHAIYLAVKQFRANQRQGTHKSKERGEIAGSTKKIKRQKGTGGARAGNIKNPLFRGGGRVFGPQPRNYSFKLNKKLKEVARSSALSYKAKNDALVVVEDFVFDTPGTKEYANILNALGVAGKKSVLYTGDNNTNVYLSSRNLPKAQVKEVGKLNTYDVLDAEVLILSESAVNAVNNGLKKEVELAEN